VSIDAVSPLEAGSPSVQLTAHGGTGSYTFSFVTNASGGTVSTSGLYAPGLTGPVTDVVKVTDGFTSAQTSISVLAFSGIVLSPSRAPLAPGTSVDVSIIGGVAPYTVDWIEGGDSSDGVITADGSAQFKYKVGFAGAAEGTTDTLKVTDSTAGTPKSATFVVTVTPALAISGPTEVSPSQIVTYTTTGGAASSTYSWSFANGETDSSLGDSNSSTETYYASPTGNFTETIIVTESPSGATASIDVTIGAPLELISPFGDATVFPRAQGTFTATGGSGTYTFSFQLNEDAHVVGNLSGGTMTADGQYQAGPIGDVTDVVQVTDGIVTRYASIPLGEALQLVGAPTSTPPNSPGFQLSTTGGTGDVSLQLLPVLAGGDCSTGLASAGSGGQIVEGIYYAGPVGNSIDRLVATDANGATATACVNVGPGVYLLNQAGDLFTNNEISIGPGETFTFIVGGGTGLYDFIGPDTNNSDATVAETDTPLTFTYTSGFACSSPQGGVKRKATRDVRAEARLARSVRKSAGPAITPGGDNTGCDDLLVAVDNYGNEADLTVHVGPRLELAITPTIVKQGGTGFVTAVGGIASLPVDYSLGDLQGSGDGRALIPAESNRNVTFQAGHTGSPSDDFPIYDEVDGQEESTGALASVSVQIGLALQIGNPFGDSTLVPGQTVSLTLYGGQCSAVFGPCDDGVQDAFNWSADSGLIVSNSTLQTVQWKLDPDVGGTSVNISTSDGLGNSASLSVSVGDILSFGCDGPCNTSPNATLSLTDYTGGGAPAYTYAFVINNSGGTVTPDGTYTVGPTGDTTDTVSVTDQFGTQRNVTFNVGAALGVFFDSGASVAPGGTAALNIQGGQGPYTAAVTTDNSGNDTLGSVHPAVGVSGNALTYTAGGGIDGTADDVITVTDAIGAKATATLHVSQRLQVAVDTNSTTLGGEAFITLSGGSANTAAFALKSNSDGSGGSKVSGSGTSFLYIAGAGHAAASFDTLTFTDGFGQNSVVINVAPSTASQQISFVTAAASTSTTTTLSNVSIDGAFVTYVKPATSGEGLGWFIQGDLDGPALFIDNQKGTLTQPSVGDVQSLTLGTVAVVYSASQANVAIVPASVVKTGSGASTASLVTNLTDTSGNVLVDPSTLLSTFPYPLESKLVYVHSQVASSGTAGTGYPAFTFGAFGNVGTVKMRTTDAVQIATGLITGCTVDLGPTPLWHNGNRTAEPSAWTTADLVVSGCPSFNVASSPAAGATGVASASQIVLTFDTPMNISTVTYNTSGAAAACGTDSLQITTGGNCISGALAWSADQKTATFTPGAPLTAGATYAIALTSAVKSNNGSGLSSSFNPTFTVASGVQACTADTPTNLANLHGALVLSQVYGGGGNSGATYANDFVELHNRGTTAITLNGVSVQFAGTTASSAYSVVALPTGTIVPGGYYLIALHRSSSTGAALPTPDFVPPNVSIAAGSGADTSTDITQANGKIALVNGSTVLATGACSGANLLDLIGYGTASCSEGTGTATAALSSTKSATRKNDPSGSAFGCVDTDSNSADFTVGTPSARNSASSAAVCVCAAP
ncbi:MAG: Ig-like domain-containing protein, partial [Deltaproteobacteria bacterium]|nr:Ig-like domain-containing protein [Deltaproteobacteria bacterium]